MNEPLLPCLKVSIKHKSNLLNIYQINKVMETMSEAHPEPCQTKINKVSSPNFASNTA